MLLDTGGETVDIMMGRLAFPSRVEISISLATGEGEIDMTVGRLVFCTVGLDLYTPRRGVQI